MYYLYYIRVCMYVHQLHTLGLNRLHRASVLRCRRCAVRLEQDDQAGHVVTACAVVLSVKGHAGVAELKVDTGVNCYIVGLKCHPLKYKRLTAKFFMEVVLTAMSNEQ